MIILRVSMATFLVAIVNGPAFGQVTLGDGTVVANEALADVYVGLIAGAVNNPSAIVDLDPYPTLFGSLDVTNAFVVADTRSVIEVSWSGITVTNVPGDDIMTGEVGSDEGAMIAVKVAGVWTNFYFATPVVDTEYNNGFLTRYDLSDMGVAPGATVESLRISNVLETDTTDEFGNSLINATGGVGYALSATDADPRYVAFLGDGFAAADFNEDGAVDASDLAQWKGDFGLNPGSDADGDGDSDGGDFLVWQRQFEGAPQLVANIRAVPEPGSLLLLFAALTSLAIHGTRKGAYISKAAR